MHFLQRFLKCSDVWNLYKVVFLYGLYYFWSLHISLHTPEICYRIWSSLDKSSVDIYSSLFLHGCNIISCHKLGPPGLHPYSILRSIWKLVFYSSSKYSRFLETSLYKKRPIKFSNIFMGYFFIFFRKKFNRSVKAYFNYYIPAGSPIKLCGYEDSGDDRSAVRKAANLILRDNTLISLTKTMSLLVQGWI